MNSACRRVNAGRSRRIIPRRCEPMSVPLIFALVLACCGASLEAQERREREPDSIYAERRANLAARVDGPIILWGFGGREEVSQAYVFEQEETADQSVFPAVIGGGDGQDTVAGDVRVSHSGT